MAVFGSLAERRDRPRFIVPSPGGETRTVTWGEYADEIRAIGMFLLELGLEMGDRSAIFAPNRVEWMSAALGIQASGGAMVPIYPASTSKQAAYVITHSDARVVFVDTPALLARLAEAKDSLGGVEKIVLFDDTLPKYPALADKCVTWSEAVAIGRAREARKPGELEKVMERISLDQPGLMLYTSGTSGDPKGVPLTHRNVAVNGRDWLESNAPVLDEGAVDLLWLPMSHIFGFGEACIGNLLGFTTYMTDPLSVMAKLPEVKPSVFMSVPSVWEKLSMAVKGITDPEARKAKLAEVTGGNLKFCLSGGAGLKREVKETFYEAGVLIIEGYGLTETSPTLTLNRPGAFRFDSVGRPLPSVELRLAEDGEILARGPSVFRGYHKDPEATNRVFTDDGWFMTGDVGRFTEDGYLQIIDRKKDILVTAGGKNVPPQNIEIRFADEPLFLHVVVYGDGKRYLTAGVWLNDIVVKSLIGDAATAEQVRGLVQERIDRVNAELASYETIKKFAIMPEALSVNGGHLTSTLKVRRKHVYQAFLDAFEALYS
jgi:long-chain acyl-CoA synthetase